jgi:hypothetical protein
MHGEYSADDIVRPRPRGYRKISIVEIENGAGHGEVVQFSKKGMDLFSRRVAEKMCLSISRLSRKLASAALMRGRLSSTRK